MIWNRDWKKMLTNVNGSINNISNIKEMTACLKDKNHISKKKSKNSKTLNTILESLDTIVMISSSMTSVTLSVIGVGLIFVAKCAGIACSISLVKEFLQKTFLNKYHNYKKQYQKDQRTIKNFDNWYRNFLEIM